MTYYDSVYAEYLEATGYWAVPEYSTTGTYPSYPFTV